MESFFAKKGLTLSKNGNNPTQKNAEHLLRTQQRNNKILANQTQHQIHRSPQKTVTIENHYNKTTNNSQISYQSFNTQQPQKFVNVGPIIRLLTNQEIVQNHPPLPKQTPWKYIPYLNPKIKTHHRQGSLEIQKNQQMTNESSFNNSFDINSFANRLSEDYPSSMQLEAKPSSRMKPAFQSNSSGVQSIGKIISKREYLNSSPPRSRSRQMLQTQKNLAGSPQRQSSTEKILNGQIIRLQKGAEDLQFQTNKKDNKYIPQGWLDEKYSLLKEINEKTIIIRQLQFKLGSIESQLKAKINNLQFEVRIIQGNKNRLQTQNQNNIRLFQEERAKNEKAKQQKDKLIFFEQDLIHAKDYSRLKEQMQSILTQNAKMFEQHQQFILEVSQARRNLNNKLEELRQQLLSLKRQYNQYRQKIDKFSEKGEEKMILIKLQNQLNFFRKKNEELMEIIISKEKELEEAALSIKDLNARHNLKDENSQKFMEEINLWQMKDTIQMYQIRIADLNQILNSKTDQIEEHKKQIQSLTSQIRNYKQDMHINSMKEKSQENSLKNEIQTLQRTLQTEIELSNKKIANLQNFLLRKTKQINDKDNFIKTFLLTRLKHLESNSAEDIISQMREYFESKENDSKLVTVQ